MVKSHALLVSSVILTATACSEPVGDSGSVEKGFWEYGDVGLTASLDEGADPAPVLVVSFELADEIGELSIDECEALDVRGGASAGADTTDADRSRGYLTWAGYASGSCGLDSIVLPLTGEEEEVWLESGGERATLRLLTPASAFAVPESTVELVGEEPTTLEVTSDPAYRLVDAYASFHPTDEAYNKEYLDTSVVDGELTLAFPHRPAGCETVPCVGELSLEVEWSLTEASCDGFSPCEVRGGEDWALGIEAIWTDG